MAHGIVDALEIVQVGGYESELAVAAQELFHELGARGTVGEPCQPVGNRLLPEAVLVIDYLTVAYEYDGYRDDDHQAVEKSRNVPVVLTNEYVYEHHRK
jgi:hypothetical protein